MDEKYVSKVHYYRTDDALNSFISQSWKNIRISVWSIRIHLRNRTLIFNVNQKWLINNLQKFLIKYLIHSIYIVYIITFTLNLKDTWIQQARNVVNISTRWYWSFSNHIQYLNSRALRSGHINIKTLIFCRFFRNSSSLN